MLFDAVVLKNQYKGLCIPGLGTWHYAESSKALMDFLQHLIPGILSLQFNATLAAARSESNNGYDYLWRVLKLMVPGFNPVVPIQTPQRLECDNIFHFSQAYLLYFRLQTKMHYHYNDWTRRGIFHCVIQHSDYTNTITTLQSHMNLYRKEYNTGFIPPHLCLHGLAKSIHQNAQACLQDIVTPCVQCLDLGSYLIQGIPNTSPLTALIICLGQSEQNGDSLRDQDGGGGYSRGC
jgi:hypothetical protein